MYQSDTYWYISFTKFYGMHTTQRLEEETLDRVRHLGKMGDSFNGVINRLLDKIDDLEDELAEQNAVDQQENDKDDSDDD